METGRAGPTTGNMSKLTNHAFARRMLEDFTTGDGRPGRTHVGRLLMRLAANLPPAPISCPQCSSPKTVRVHQATLKRSFVECIECGEQFTPKTT